MYEPPLLYKGFNIDNAPNKRNLSVILTKGTFAFFSFGLISSQKYLSYRQVITNPHPPLHCNPQGTGQWRSNVPSLSMTLESRIRHSCHKESRRHTDGNVSPLPHISLLSKNLTPLLLGVFPSNQLQLRPFEQSLGAETFALGLGAKEQAAFHTQYSKMQQNSWPIPATYKPSLEMCAIITLISKEEKLLHS